MGYLQNGIWIDQWYDTKKTEGKFKREQSQFRFSLNGNNKKSFKAETGRYHLYVSLACPWAHRTLIFRKLKELEQHISVSIVHPHILENGWEFDQDIYSDSLFNSKYLYQIYIKAKSNYTGRVTIPILWDKQDNIIVSNESIDIIRIFNSEFNKITGNTIDLYPRKHKEDIDEINEWIYHNINNGVYKVGFATTQDVYEKELNTLFKALDKIELHLENKHYLIGAKLTESDWRLFTTLIRFDAVYYGHFKANLKQIRDYKNIYRYLKNLYEHKGIKETVNFSQIKQHYYYSHTTINPTRIVPVGPKLDFK